MLVEIVTTGSELLLGQIVNKNAAWLAAELNKIGFDVIYQSTVGDNRTRMEEVLTHALTRADIIITTGGLGPTRGDITKEVSSAVMGRDMQLDPATIERIKAYFSRVGRTMTKNNLRQAMIPLGAQILPNDAGTAPGIILEDQTGKTIINLPGPPRECQAMFNNALKPYLIKRYGKNSVIVSRVLNTYGIGESLLETRLDDLITAQKNPTLALLARPTGVIIRLTAKASDTAEAHRLIAPLEIEICRRLGSHIYASDDEPLEKVVGTLLAKKNQTVATAESCTGGLIATRLTDISGSSLYVKGGIVAYTNEVKNTILGVSSKTLADHTAVSSETAREMANGVRKKFGTNYGVATTGLAGPEGDGTGRPVGLVYIAIATADATMAKECHFARTRQEIRFAASQTALFLLKNAIENRYIDF